jgi:predicted Fe-S protein YdhL (DUF1289 family)
MSGSVESPCVRKCKLKDKRCEGCGRSLEQIKHWISYTPEQQKKIIEDLNGKAGE